MVSSSGHRKYHVSSWILPVVTTTPAVRARKMAAASSRGQEGDEMSLNMYSRDAFTECKAGEIKMGVEDGGTKQKG